MHYTLVAYRYGQLNAHQYKVAQTDRLSRALELAQEARNDRAGKYGVAVYQWEGEDHCKQVVYFPSQMREKEPFDNVRLEQYLALGHWVVDAVIERQIRVARRIGSSLSGHLRLRGTAGCVF